MSLFDYMFGRNKKDDENKQIKMFEVLEKLRINQLIEERKAELKALKVTNNSLRREVESKELDIELLKKEWTALTTDPFPAVASILGSPMSGRIIVTQDEALNKEYLSERETQNSLKCQLERLDYRLRWYERYISPLRIALDFK